MPKKSTKKKETDKQKVDEIFEIEKEGKEKTVEVHAVEEEKTASPEQIKRENKILKNIVVAIIGFALMFFIVYMIIASMSHFKVEGVNFEIVKEQDLVFYKTSLPVLYNGSQATYNFFLRTDPRTLEEKVPITGNLTFRKNLVMDVTTEELFCGGHWTIATVNLGRMYGIFGFNLLVKNESAIYAPMNEYMFITINKGNKTEIRQTGYNSYEMNIKDCEVLPAFERLMLETLAQDKKLNS